MRRALDLLGWVLAIAAVSAVFCLSSAPDVEASLGIPACAGNSHSVPCRYCAHKGKGRLPGVIDAYNVRFIPPVAKADTGETGF